MACRCQRVERLARKFGQPLQEHPPVYLDHAATTPVDRRTLARFEEVCLRVPGNPASYHQAGVQAARVLAESREILADYLGRPPADLFFCASGTEGMNAVVYGLGAPGPGGQGRLFLSTTVEHSALARSLEKYGRRPSGPAPLLLPVDGQGRPENQALETALEQARLAGLQPVLFIATVNHESGARQDCEGLFRRLKAAGGLLVQDAVQALARVPAAEWAPWADALVLSSHKVHAPKGSGALVLSKALRQKGQFRRLRTGGGQEGGLFPGTPNLPGIAAFARAVEILGEELAGDIARMQALEQDFVHLLNTSGLEHLWNSPPNSAPGHWNISLPWVQDMEALLLHLARRNISLSRFSACSSDTSGPSKILLALGLPEARASRSLRISLGRSSSRGDLQALVKALGDYRRETGRD